MISAHKAPALKLSSTEVRPRNKGAGPELERRLISQLQGMLEQGEITWQDQSDKSAESSSHSVIFDLYLITNSGLAHMTDCMNRTGSVVTS